MEKADRKALLKGDVEIWLKDKIHFLNDKYEFCNVTNFRGHRIAIVEKNGKCYVSLPFDSKTLTGILYETRDSFDELVAQYSQTNERRA